MSVGSATPHSRTAALSRWLRAQRLWLTIGLGAFIVRAVENLWVHPPLLDTRSDMGGYIHRAEALARGDWSADPKATFFPVGTHGLVFILKWIFGRYDSVAVSLCFAAIGTAAVLFCTATAKRLWPARPWAPWAVGALMALEPAWVELGSFVLSETPTALAVSAAAFFSLRLMDDGKTKDAFWLGFTLALGSIFRPQVLAMLPFLALAALLRRKTLARVAITKIGLLFLPILVVLALSSARIHYDNGVWGTYSTNGPFNWVFGRCHCYALTARQTSGARFQPPSLKALENYKERHGMTPIITLDPAMGNELSFDGKVWESAPAYALARQCVERTGPLRQIKYAITHWMLLWAYNLPWPTDTIVSSIGMVAYAIIQLPGLVVALVLALRKSRGRELVLLSQVFGLLTTAALFFGEARLRAPYDGVIVILALGIYADAVALYRARRGRATEVGSDRTQLD